MIKHLFKTTGIEILYQAEYTYDRHSWAEGRVYPMSKGIHTDGSVEYFYVSDVNGDMLFEAEECIPMFAFSFCYRGVWDGRIYFKKEEYNSEGLSDMNDIWNQLQEILKAEIRQRKPDIRG